MESRHALESNFSSVSRLHLLRLVDEQHRTKQGLLDVGEPALSEKLGAGPAVVGRELDAEEVAELTVEVRHATLGSADYADPDVHQG